MRSRDADIVGSVTLNVDTQALDGRLDLSLSEELSKQAGTDLIRFTREGNRVVLPARVGGTIAAPRAHHRRGSGRQARAPQRGRSGG